jgi:hypothetical protein
VLNDRIQYCGWQGACLVAITYSYFPIFAQFAFLKRIANFGLAGPHLKTVIGLGTGFGYLFATFRDSSPPQVRCRYPLRAAFAWQAFSLRCL